MPVVRNLADILERKNGLTGGQSLEERRRNAFTR